MYDVIIVGGGPAGLNAALVLARCRRSILVFDTRHPRNGRSRGMHGYLTRDGIPPADFLMKGRDEVAAYGVVFREEEVVSVRPSDTGFEVTTRGGEQIQARKLLLATGLLDTLPAFGRIDEFYGISVFHCPYCDGWESRGKAIGVCGKTKSSVPLALSLRTWSDRVTLFSNGVLGVRPADRELLEENGVQLEPAKVLALDGEQGVLRRLMLADGREAACEALFISFGYAQHSSLVAQLGCAFTRKGVIRTDKHQETNVRGVYVAGDAARDMQMVVVAAAEGARAGVAINMSLQLEEIRQTEPR